MILQVFYILRKLALAAWIGILETSLAAQNQESLPDTLDHTLSSEDGKVQAWWTLEGDFVHVNALRIRYPNSKGTVTRSFEEPVIDTCTSVGELICAESALDLPRPLEITQVNDTVTVIRGYSYSHPLVVILLWILDGDQLYRIGCVTFRGVYDLDWKYDPLTKRLQLYGNYLSPGSDVFIPEGANRVSRVPILQKRKKHAMPDKAYNEKKPLYDIQF